MKQKTERRKRVLAAEDRQRKERNREMLRRFRLGELIWQLELKGLYRKGDHERNGLCTEGM